MICNISSWTLALLKTKYQRKGEIAVIEYCEKYGLDKDEIISRITGSSLGTTQISTEDVAQVDRINDGYQVRKIDTTSNLAQYYGVKYSNYLQMLHKLKTELIKRVLFDYRVDTKFKDPNKRTKGVSHINNAILTYKLELLQSIKNAFSNLKVNIDLNAINAIKNEQFESVLQYFWDNQDSISDETLRQSALDAYVILKNFDALLETHAPFIEVDARYKTQKAHLSYKYNYVPAGVKHYKGSISKNEYASAEETTGEMIKLLLEYLPEIYDGKVIENSSIGVAGFDTVMQRVKNWVKTDDAMWEEYKKGVNADMQKIINAYLDANPNEVLQNKLYAISNLVFGKNSSDEFILIADIRNVLLNRFNKYVSTEYIGYKSSEEDPDELIQMHLTERDELVARGNLTDAVKGSIIYWAQNISDFDTLLKNLDDLDLESLKQLFYDLTYVLIPNDFERHISDLGVKQKGDVILKNIIAYIKTKVNELAANPNLEIKIISDYSNAFYGNINDLAKIFARVEQTSVRSVIRNQEGNNLPLHQLPCLTYMQREMVDRIDMDRWDTTFSRNFVKNNFSRVSNPIIKSSITYKDRVKSMSKCSVEELTHIGFIQDFFAPLINNSKKIGLQSHCYADKTKYFIQPYDLSGTWTFDDKSFNLNQLLFDIVDHNDEAAIATLKSLWKESMLSQYEALGNNILSDFAEAFPLRELNTLSDIETLFNEVDFSEIQAVFRSKQLDFVEDVHYSKINKKPTINKTLETLIDIYSDDNKFEKFFESQYNMYKNDMAKNWSMIGFDKTLLNFYKGKVSLTTAKKWVADKYTDEYGQIQTKIDQIDSEYLDANNCPAIMAFFLAHNVLGLNHNRILYGDAFAHPNKEKGADALSYDAAMASRWTAQTKRLAVAGATFHNLAQDLKYGVLEEVKVAVMDDIKANVNNIIGDDDKIDSCDGSGYVNPIYSRMINHSLLDAKVGSGNRKTIFADVSAKYGNATLLKWAEYEITNEKRRNSQNGVNFDELVKKMESELIPENILENILSFVYVNTPSNNLGYYDINTGRYYKINAVSFELINGQLFANRTMSELDENGFQVQTITGMLPIDTIWDLDQCFGGCYCGSFVDGKWLFNELNQDVIYNAVCESEWKEHLIGYIVNKSAIKVGARNINKYGDDGKLWTTTVSTKFGGIQMDADHELEESESTEPTQMITALAQDGNSTEQVNQVYNKIADIALASISDYVTAANKDQLYNIVKKAIIKAFATGEKDEIGLAQAFIAFAQSDAAEELGYKIPFSADTINGIFNSTVLSNISKKAIKRKYRGFAGVLNPSYGIMQYYEIGGKKVKYTDVVTMLRKSDKYNPAINISEYFNDVMYDATTDSFNNPFVERLIGEPDFEDTIVVKYKPYTQPVHLVTYDTGETRYYLNGVEIDPDFVVDGSYKVPGQYIDENGNITEKIHAVIKIDSYDKYIQYRHRSDLDLYNFTARPKNLKGYNVTYKTTDAEGRVEEFSLYDHRFSKYLHQITKSDFSKNKLLLDNDVKKYFTNTDLHKYIDRTIEIYGDSATIDNLKELLNKDLQKFIDSLTVGRTLSGNRVINEVNVHPAQVIAGRTNAKEFMLQAGDDIATIKEQGPEFFRKRLSGKYNDLNIDKDSYDFVMFDGSGKTLYVTFRQPTDRSRLSLNDDYCNVGDGGTIFYGEQEICSADGKQFYKYTDSNGTVHDLLVLDENKWKEQLVEIRKTSRWVNAKSNFNHFNFDVLYKLKQEKDWNDEKLNGEAPYLLYYTENGKIQRKNLNANYGLITASDTIIKMLNDDQTILQGFYFDRKAKNIYDSFIKSLMLVGTRIPCQSMQSFVPMEIVMFCDSTVNEIYLPTHVTWVQGSDYDIDKQYLIGYEPTADGEILMDYNGSNFNLQTTSLRNAIVDSIFRVTTDPKNFINMTTPITMDNVDNLAAKSTKGREGKTMSPNNPISVYKLQVENSIGKTTIGVSATGTKSYLSLSQYYNNTFNHIYDLIAEGDYDQALKILKTLLIHDGTDRRGVIHFDRARTLSGVNLKRFTEEFIQKIPNETLKNYLASLKARPYYEPRAILRMGELLNAATDNAKHLYLKKINADADWTDVYIYGLTAGWSLDDIYNLMQNPEINVFIESYGSNIFSDKSQSFDKVKAFMNHFIEKWGITGETNAEKKIAFYNELSKHKRLKTFYNLLKQANVYKILGQITKINQGLPTKKYDLYNYVYKINKAISDTCEMWDFDVIRFINDDYETLTWIEFFEEARTRKQLAYNPLAVLNGLPHVKNMWKALTTGVSTMNELSTKNAVHYIKLANKRYNSEEEFNQKLNEENQRMNLAWLQSFSFGYTIPAEWSKKITNVETDTDKTHYITGTYGIDQFKRYMNLYVIPMLKKRYPDNEFIKALRFGIDRKTKSVYFRLPINMMEVDKNPVMRATYERISNGFNQLASVDVNNNPKYTFDGHNIVNLFYLYNLFTNKGFSQNSMTRLFAEQVTVHNQGAFVIEHAQWLDSQTVDVIMSEPRVNTNAINDVKDTLDVNQLKAGKNWMTSLKVLDSNVDVNVDEMLVEDDVVIDNLLEKQNTTLYTDGRYWPGDIFYIKNNQTGKTVKVIVEASNKVATIKADLEADAIPEKYYKLDLSKSIVLNDLLTNDEYYKKHIVFINSENIYKTLSKYGLDKQKIDESCLSTANAFVFNGDIFINTDNATDEDVVHEFAHLFIADMKLSQNEENRRNLINALTKVQQHPLYKELRLNPRYQLLREEDFAEEVLATLIGQDIDYLHRITDVFKESTDPVKDFIDAMLSTSKIGSSYRANVFVKNTKIAQKIASFRNEAIEQGFIKEECN